MYLMWGCGPPRISMKEHALVSAIDWLPGHTNLLLAICGLTPPGCGPTWLGCDWGVSTPHGHWWNEWFLEKQSRQMLCLLLVAMKVCAYRGKLMVPQSMSGADAAWSRKERPHSHQPRSQSSRLSTSGRRVDGRNQCSSMKEKSCRAWIEGWHLSYSIKSSSSTIASGSQTSPGA